MLALRLSGVCEDNPGQERSLVAGTEMGRTPGLGRWSSMLGTWGVAENEGSGVGAVGKLKIQFVKRLPHLPEELPEGVIEVCIRLGRDGIDVGIVRQGFIASSRATDAITERVRHLIEATADRRPIPECIGLSPVPSTDWCEFLDDLFRQDDSWAFIVQPTRVLMPS